MAMEQFKKLYLTNIWNSYKSCGAFFNIQIRKGSNGCEKVWKTKAYKDFNGYKKKLKVVCKFDSKISKKCQLTQFS